MDQFQERSADVLRFNTIQDAYHKTLEHMAKDDVLIIIGSHYLAGEFLQKIQFS
jgi:folylpolyglutamate synthase/dihydropteroate synthase